MFFKKKKNYEDTSLVFAINPNNACVGSSTISDQFKISGKYYKFVPDFFDDVFKPESNIALYIRAKYTGVYATNFDFIMGHYYQKLLKEVTPVRNPSEDELLCGLENYKINFVELFEQTKEYSTEMDFKGSMPDVKHVLHFHDNENETEGYFVYYDSDFIDVKFKRWFDVYLKVTFTSRCHGCKGTLCH